MESIAWFGLCAAVLGIIISNGFANGGVVIFLLAWLSKKLFADRSWPALDNLWLLLAAFFLWAAISLFNSSDAWVSARGLSKLIKYFLICFAVSDFVREEKALRRSLLLLMGAAFIAGLDGIFQHLSGFDFFRIHLIDKLDELYRATASFQTANDFAGYLVLVTPVFLGALLFSGGDVRKKILAAIPLAVLLLCLYRTGSRAAWISFMAGVLFFSFLARKRWVIVAFLVMLVIGIVASPATLQRAKDLFSLKQTTTWERVKLWQGALTMIKVHPLLGHGINTYNINFPLYRPEDYLPDNRYAHNCYLQMAAEVGIVGASIFLLFLFSGLTRCVKAFRRLADAWLRFSLFGLTAGILAFLLHSATDTNLYSVRLATLFWLSFGLAVAGSRLAVPRRIFFIRTDRIGDLLLNTPAIGALRKAFPESYICVLAGKAGAEVLHKNPDVDEVMIYDEQMYAGFTGSLRLLGLICSGRFDTAVISNPGKKFHLLAFLCGIPVRVGYDRKWGFLLTHKLRDKKYLAQKHEVDYNLELVGLIGAVTASPKVEFAIDASDEEKARMVMAAAGLGSEKKIIAIHPGTSNPLKRWEPENFSRLAERIVRELGASVVLVGGEEEKPVSRTVAGESSQPVTDLTGRFSLKPLGAFLKKTELLVSSDSAPVHIAAAVGTPAVVLFAKGVAGCDPKRWGPYGSKSVLICEDLKALSPDEVFCRVKEIYGKDIGCQSVRNR